MAMIVTGADGVEREFPDGTPDAVIDRVMKSEGTTVGGGTQLPGLTPGIAPAVGGGVLVGGTKAAQMGAQAMKSPAGRAAGGVLAKDLPGNLPFVGGLVRTGMKAADAAKKANKAQPPEPSPGAPGSGKLPKSVILTPEDVATHKAFSKFPPGYEMDRATYQREIIKSGTQAKSKPFRPSKGPSKGPKAPSGTKNAGSYQERGRPTRPIKVIDKNIVHRTTAPAPTPESPGAGRGASGPELERRAASMARTRASTPEPNDLEALLSRSTQASGAAREAALKAGLGEAEAASIAARAARGAIRVPGVLGALLTVLGAADTPEQMDEAQRIYQESTQPASLRRLLGEAPQGF